MAASAVSAAAVPASPQVRVADGLLAGERQGNIESFRGIPFGAPPVESLRWRSPQPVAPWKGVREAVRFGPNCLQIPPAYIQGDASTRYSEDCLYLNVWKPAGNAAKRPVLVWLYGGAFINGGTSFPIYDGTAFARRGIIFVSVNYRLGRLGFFAHPALSAAHEETLGNYAYADQIAALKWVRRNIGSFGGDPDRVTLMGESAGGISVADLLTAPDARGLFQQAIIMSGGGRAAMANRPLHSDGNTLPSAEQVGLAYAHSEGIYGEGADALARLRALPESALTRDLVGSNLKINGEPRGALTHVGGPIIDGTTKQGVVDAEIQKLGGVPMPVMVGTTSGDLGVATEQTKDELFAAFGASAGAARTAYDPDGRQSADDVRTHVTRDRLLTEPARFIAQEAVRAGHAAYFYRFGYIPTGLAGTWKTVPHGGDVSFFLDTPGAQRGAKASAADVRVAEMTAAYVANFVLHGNPNGPGLPAWASFQSDPAGIMQIGPKGTARMIEDPLHGRLDLVEASAGAPLVEKATLDAR